ncbi:TPA: hypothetical protein QDZ42_001005 [Stenotrophomonas maltophilia]|uniref:hypothetical protein n=1 Tax=Stenotrophomonas sp. TaxID=69392 RepID=UPI0028B15FFC|nr:hypothetical protein [Stenotrophomonas sp.]HDS1037892.1 hypothetical protein [Stenotrophomonas maltophilia]HDS1042381.1 hypothetical protein [Stenotrophomonas maltophilia]
MSLTDVQIAVLRAIAAAKVISPVETHWALGEGYATDGDEGEIALTPVGHNLLADGSC